MIQPKSKKLKVIIAEDALKKIEKNMQELTDKYCKEADDLCGEKRKRGSNNLSVAKKD